MTRSHHILSPLAVLSLAAAALAQPPQQDWLVTFSQQETSMSGSGGTMLRDLLPNEIHHIDWNGGSCNTVSAEKWAPRTALGVMAGDENADGALFNPGLFGRIDALVATWRAAGLGGENQRTVFWSPAAAMGTNVSGVPGLRPGDVGRIVRNGAGDGQVEHFMRREQFNQAMGLPLGTPIDIDAIAFSTQVGVLFSLDTTILGNNGCGPTLFEEGAVIGISNAALTMTPDLRVAAVLPGSAFVIYTAAQVDAMVVNAQVTNRFGACIPNAIDLESLELDWNGTGSFFSTCATVPGMFVPALLFTTESMTGASVLSTAGGGSIHGSTCGLMGRTCGSGPTLGNQLGIRPSSAALGAPSFVNALVAADTGRYVLQPQLHSIPMGAPAGFTSIDVGSPFLFNFIFLEVVSPFVPASLPGLGNHFPDVYVPSLLYYLWTPAAGGFGSFPTPGLPALFSGKLLFQSVAISSAGTFELSTPAVLDV